MTCPATTIVSFQTVICSRLREHETHEGTWTMPNGDRAVHQWTSPAELDEGVTNTAKSVFGSRIDAWANLINGLGPGRVQTLDDVKERWDLIPWEQLHAVERVLTHGLTKHGSDFGWKERARAEHVQALLRHVIEYARGKRFDDDTKQPVLAHVVARALFVMFHDGEVLK